MSGSFFSRWSQRKQAVAKGLPADDNKARTETAQDQTARVRPSEQGQSAATGGIAAKPVQAADAKALAGDQTAGAEQPLPTAEDLKGLTPSSDFQPFMRQGVAADVRNAAVKKLFTDPHFNVMDGLDIYIGDYNTPDPLPAGMLQKMVGAQLLNLFTPSEKVAEASGGQVALLPNEGENPLQSPDAPEGSPLVAQSPPSPMTPALQATPTLQALEPTAHDHPDLQLQPNHVPASPSPGPSTG